MSEQSTLDILNQRRSVRMFTGEPIPDNDMQEILSATQQAPTSINAQGLSLIVIGDPERIKAVADIAGGQPQVAGAALVVVFVMDFHRTGAACKKAGKEQVIHRSAEGLMVGAVDAGIALATFQTAAAALGYGTTAIGGIRMNPDKLIELLELPPHTYPLVASTIGVPEQMHFPKVKPRVALDTFALPEKYDAERVEGGIDPYDETLRAWWDKQGMHGMNDYSTEVGQTYSFVYFPKVAQTLRDQGFNFSDTGE